MRVIGLAGWSGSGKTTLLTKAIPRLVSRGLRVSTVKHAHHSFDLDQPGKDSYEHRAAGATEVAVGTSNRWALMHELRGGEAEPDLAFLLQRLSPVDLVLVEGYKREPHPKLEVHRAGVGKLMQPDDPAIVAVAADRPVPEATVPVIDLNDIEAVIEAMLTHAAPLETVLARRSD